MMTYQDYDQIRFKMEEIGQVYKQQYESEVGLVKERMRREMEERVGGGGWQETGKIVGRCEEERFTFRKCQEDKDEK